MYRARDSTVHLQVQAGALFIPSGVSTKSNMSIIKSKMSTLCGAQVNDNCLVLLAKAKPGARQLESLLYMGEKSSRGHLYLCESCFAGEERVRLDHESEAGNQRMMLNVVVVTEAEFNGHVSESEVMRTCVASSL